MLLEEELMLSPPPPPPIPPPTHTAAVGDKVPADCRMLEINSASFRVDQSILTGESVSVSKDITAITDKRAVKQDMTNIIFSVYITPDSTTMGSLPQGTTISTGKARAIVVHTGSNTAIGDIHQSISNQETEKTPLKKKLDDFGDSLAKVSGP